MFESLDYVYVPTADVDATARRYVDDLGAELVFKVRGMGTVVACLRVAGDGPAILLSGHLEGETPILIYRVADYDAAVERLRAAAIPLHELEIPQGPCASFRAPGGQRYAVYELRRPGAADHFVGRVDDCPAPLCRRELPRRAVPRTVRAMTGTRSLTLPARGGLIALALLLPR